MTYYHMAPVLEQDIQKTLPHEAAQIVAEWLHEEAQRRSEVEYTEKEIADWAARIGNIN
jgi:hypothetical protein